MKKSLFIKNTLILTASSLLLRFIGIIFKVWLAKKIGSEGIGLYQLVFSVYILASTFAISGTSTAVTRLVSEELALGSKKGVLKILRRAIQLTLVIAFLSVILLLSTSNFIGKTLLNDVRTIPALKILPLSLPFIGVTSCLRGYFIARRKVAPNALSQIFEQIIRIALILFLINRFIKHGLSACCFAVIFGDAIAEIISCLCLYFIFLFDKRNLKNLAANPTCAPVVRKILHISVPITSGRYLNSALRTAENIFVPKNLAKFPKSSKNALSQFGMIKGMALPLLFFPSAVLNAISTLLIPEISEAVALKKDYIVKTSCERIFKITFLVGLLFGSIFMVAGREIGQLIYKDQSVGFLIMILSPIVPLMYLDSICDGILKGLDQQRFTFRTAITDSVLRIIMILIMLPKMGLNGFIVIMYFSNFFTCFLNITRLIKISNAAISISKNVLLPLCCAGVCTLLSRFIILRFFSVNLLFYTILFCAFTCVMFIVSVIALKIVKKEDFLR